MHARMHVRFPLVAVSLLLAACSSLPTTSLPGGEARLHVVLFWLKPDMPAAERAAMPAAIREKGMQVPGVDSIWVGQPAGTPRAVVDNSYDLMVVMRFQDAAALTAWEPHPLHQELLARFGPHVAKIQVYDGK